jgi:starvation-inducible DNA-binding protein
MKILQPAQSEVIEMLHQTLATTVDLKTYIKQVQWNQDINFYQHHAIFEEIVALVEEYIDFFAASLVVLNRVNVKTDFLKASPNDPPDTIICIKNKITALATRLEPYAKLLREANYRSRT